MEQDLFPIIALLAVFEAITDVVDIVGVVVDVDVAVDVNFGLICG